MNCRMINKAYILLVVVLFFILLYLNSDHAKTIVMMKTQRKTNPLLISWKSCMLQEAEKFRGKYKESWDGWGKVINTCGKEVVSKLNISPFKNKDEVKYHVLPRVNSSSTIVTLGVGHDVLAEKKLQTALGKDNVEFFGADPIVDVNEKLYSEVGKFFPFAVSDKSGYTNASVMTEYYYFDKVVVNVEMIYFLTEMIQQRFYDHILMDAEYAEYKLFPYINRGGKLDQNEIIVCQWNMEIHSPTLEQKKLTHDFFFQTIEEGRYGFFHAYYVGHYRLYFLNFDDERCQRKYIPEQFQTWKQ